MSYTRPCGLSCNCSSVLLDGLSWLVCDVAHCSWVVRVHESIASSGISKAGVPQLAEIEIVGPLFTEVSEKSQSFLPHSQYSEAKMISLSYLSKDRKSSSLRYIRVAAIDIVISQGIWNVCVEAGPKTPISNTLVRSEQRRTTLRGSDIRSRVEVDQHSLSINMRKKYRSGSGKRRPAR